jgi:hypothetical protein
MKSVTINIDEDLLRKAKVQAARDNQSVAAFLAGLVVRAFPHSANREITRRYSPEYEKAMGEYLAQVAFLHLEPGQRWLTREEIYDRSLLRRHERLALREDADGGYETRSGEGVD